MSRLTWRRPSSLAHLALLLLAACRTDPGPEDRAWVVGAAWFVVLADDRVCIQDDLYMVPGMDEPEEAIRACRDRLNADARQPTAYPLH